MIGNIYAIVCNETGEMYIGSTTKTIEHRLSQHKLVSNSCSSKQIIDRKNYKLQLLESSVYDTKSEILSREKHWIHQSIIEGGTVINKATPIKYEINKEILLKSKEEIEIYTQQLKEIQIKDAKAYTKQYQDSHKPYFKAKREEHKEKWQGDFKCSCGITCRLINKNRHQQSLEHKKYILSQELILFNL
jgi:hypothetical protein